jgi:tRNA-specific adenosine deaminase 3
MRRTVDGAIEAQAEKEEVRAVFSSHLFVAVPCAAYLIREHFGL